MTGQGAADAAVRLAPQVIVRAACWPLSLLDTLQAPELAAAARAADASGGAAWDAYARAYADALPVQRRRLWRVSAEDPGFMRALALANPELAARALRTDPDTAAAKRVRHLARALYRYLARAVSRSEPCDLWAGAALARWGERTRVTARPPRHVFSPDLRPFQTMLRALGSRPEYRRGARWKLNLTLHRAADGGWEFWQRRTDGNLVQRRTRPAPALDVLIEALRACGAATLDELAEALRRRPELAGVNITADLAACADGGVLVGGLDLPGRFASAWEALAIAEEQLLAAERAAWRAAREDLQRIATALEARCAELPPAALLQALDEAAGRIGALAAALGLPPPALPRTVLRCDLGLPFEIVLGPDVRGLIERSLATYSGFQRSFGFGPDLRRQGLRRVHDAGGVLPLARVEALKARLDGPLTWEAVCRSLGDEPAMLARVARWRAVLAAGGAVTPAVGPADAAAPPFGVFLLGIAGTDAAPQVAVHGVFDQLAPLYARFTPLWRDAGAGAALHHWFRGELAALEAQAGIEAVELIAACEANPNALARPSFTGRVLDVWGATAAEPGWDAAEAFVDPASGTPLLRVPGRSRPVAVFHFASADVALKDPLVRLLILTSFFASQLPLRASTVAFEHELGSGVPSPAVILDEGSLVRPRRTVIAAGEWQALAAAAGPLRFARWQQLAARHGWPAIVAVRQGAESAMVVPRDSPLALESLFDSRLAGHGAVVVEEPPREAWLSADGKERHVAELAVPFVRETHAWSARGSGERPRGERMVVASS